MTEAALSVKEAQARANRYWESDGLAAMVAGVGFGMLGAGDLWSHYPNHTSTEELLAYLLMSAAFALLAATTRITTSLKARITYPRTGYAAPPEYLEPRSAELRPNMTVFGPRAIPDRKAFDILSAIPTVLLVLGFIYERRWCFAVFALLWLVLAWRYRESPQIPWYTKFLPPLLGCVLTLLPVSLDRARGLLVILYGTYATISGIVKFTFYLRKHPVRSA